MTTFQYRSCSLRKATALIATAVIWASAAHANSDQSPSPVVQRGKPTCTTFALPASDNRYVLLLFFSSDPAYQSGIEQLLGSATQPGCITDPDPDPAAKSVHGILVQGGCPTDCVHPPKVRAKYVPGDPLSNLSPKAGWGIFFADPTAAVEVADKDTTTTFKVWKILARDSCHAGKILKSLVNDPSNVFTPGGGYLGQIMIGYTPLRPAAHGSGSTKGCSVYRKP